MLGVNGVEKVLGGHNDFVRGTNDKKCDSRFTSEHRKGRRVRSIELSVQIYVTFCCRK